MSIEPMKIDNVAILPSGQTGSKGAPQVTQDAGKGTQAADQVLLTGNLDARFQELQAKNQRSNAAAGAIRNTDRAWEVVSQKIDAMKATLDTLVKNFPPFAVDDKDRMDLMRTYSSIRKEIDQLVMPPPPDVVKARKAQDLPPQLRMDASVSQIADHMANLDAVSTAIDGMRAEMATETAALTRDGRFADIFHATKGAEKPSNQVSLTESEATQKSVEVGRQFATGVSQGVTSVSSQFLRGL